MVKPRKDKSKLYNNFLKLLIRLRNQLGWRTGQSNKHTDLFYWLRECLKTLDYSGLLLYATERGHNHSDAGE